MSGTQAELTEGVPFVLFPNIRIIAGKTDGGQVRPVNLNFPLFRLVVERDLRRIHSKPVGSSLLKKINEAVKMGGPRCYIALGKATLGGDVPDDPPAFATVYLPSMRPGAAAGGIDADNALSNQEYGGRGKPGHGAPAIVGYNPFFNYTMAYAGTLGIPMPSFVILAHELIHASHTARGKYRKMPGWATPALLPNGAPMIANEEEQMVEEARTIGAGKYAARRITENAIRREHQIAERPYYVTPGDCDAANLPAWSPALKQAEEDAEF